MPCTDGGVPYDRVSTPSLEARNQELAQEICRLGKLISTLYSSDAASLMFSKNSEGAALNTEVMRALRKYKDHREHDRRQALIAAEKQYNELNNTRKKIEGLGGRMGEELATKLALAREVMKCIPDTDPLNTDLY